MDVVVTGTPYHQRPAALLLVGNVDVGAIVAAAGRIEGEAITPRRPVPDHRVVLARVVADDEYHLVGIGVGGELHLPGVPPGGSGIATSALQVEPFHTR